MADNYFGKSDIGRMRDNNEDTFIAYQCSNGIILGAAIDGVGGYSGGEIASAMARDIILDAFKSPDENILNILDNSFRVANEKIGDERRRIKDHNKMACVLTVVAADVSNNCFYYCHLGDTRLYLFRDGGLVKISHDDSAVGFLEDSGRISEAEAMRHPKRNEINKALGFEEIPSDADDFLEKGSSPFLPGDILLLCSDGLTDLINQEQMVKILVKDISLEDKTQSLIEAANEAGGKDNITVVLIKNDKLQTQHTAVKPDNKKEKRVDAVEEVSLNREHKLVTANEHLTRKSRPYISVTLACVLIGLFAYWYLHQPKSEVLKPAFNERAMPFTNLQEGVNDGVNKTLVLRHSSNVLFIKDSILVGRDSLHIMGNGITISGDSLYHEIGMIIEPSCHYILLDSITFKDLSVGILVKQKGLHLNNVQFINCNTPIIYKFLQSQSIGDTIKKLKQVAK